MGVDDTIKIWDVASGENLAAVKFGYQPPPPAIRTIGDTFPRIAGIFPGIFEGAYETVEAITFTPDNRIVVVLVDVQSEDRWKIIREVLSIPNGRK